MKFTFVVTVYIVIIFKPANAVSNLVLFTLNVYESRITFLDGPPPPLYPR